MLAAHALKGFVPAIRLFDRLSFSKKFVVVGIVLAAPLAYVLYSYLGEKRTQIGFSAKERVGVVEVAPAANLLGALVEARAAAVREAAHDPGAATASAKARADVAAASGEVDAADEKVGAQLAVSEEWSKLKRAIADVTGRSYATPRQAFDTFNGLTAQALTFVVDIGNNSNLILDPDLDSYYLMDNTINKLPIVADAAGATADFQDVIAHTRGSTLALRAQLAVYQGTLSSNVSLFETGFKTAFGSTKDAQLEPGLRPGDHAAAAASKPVLTAAAAVVGGATPSSATSAAGQRAAAGAIALEQRTLPFLDHLLAVRIGKFERQRTQVLWIVILAAILATYLFVAFWLAVRRSLASMRATVSKVGKGDLTAAVEASSRDELGAMARDFEAMLASIRTMVGTVAQSARELDNASKEMARSAEEAGGAVGEIASAVGEVAEGAERQVRTVDEAKSATAEMVATASSGAENAVDTAAAAREARELSERGVSAVESASEAMRAVRDTSSLVTEAIRDLGEKSTRIGGIVETITRIAEQTNLLALNAAIEAARAGEHGRGFAVVADEVRKLAEESQEAAASIAQLIEEIQAETRRTVTIVEEGAQRTEDGVATVDNARTSFLAIGSRVEDVSARVELIAAAIQQLAASSERLRTGIDEVASVAEQSSAVAEQVSASTEETSASAQEIAGAAQQLSQTAGELDTLVNRFTLVA